MTPDINAGIQTYEKLKEYPYLGWIIAAIALIVLAFLIYVWIEKLGDRLNINIERNFNFIKDDISQIRKCNEDLLVKYPILEMLYERREIFEEVYQNQIRKKKKTKIEIISKEVKNLDKDKLKYAGLA